MYRCPNCGANMAYDIKRKELYCDFCDTGIKVDEHPKQQQDAKEATYDTTLYRCPQCGGEITSTENAATEFCTYCGMTVVLDGHLSKEKKPDYIVPFQLTKEDCKNIYRKRTHSIWCMPNELKDENYLNRFIPIYMPYLVYNARQHGTDKFTGSNTHGKYEYRYEIDATMDNKYDWMIYDASSKFYDELSDAISDYTMENSDAFKTGYLAGFYADNPDVEQSTYVDETRKNIENRAITYLSQNARDDKGRLISGISKKNKTMFGGGEIDAKTALFPVWFLTWRQKDRVAYSVVNGETGSCEGDYPISMKKFLLFSLLFSIPFLAFFLFMPVFLPDMLLNITLCFSMIILTISGIVLTSQLNHDEHLKDKGVMSQKEDVKPYRIFILFYTWPIVMAICTLVIGRYAFSVVSIVYIFFLSIKFCRLSKKKHDPSILLGLLFVPFAVTACAIQLWNPVSDMYHYAGIVAILIGTCLEFMFLIKRYNLSCSLPVPVYYERSSQ